MSYSRKINTYKRIKKLGEGAFGKAYLVERTEDKKLCVIKEMDLGKMGFKERKVTLAEAKILEKLHHPNIVTFIEIYISKRKKLCIVMDYADGGDLSQKVDRARKRNRHFPENQIID